MLKVIAAVIMAMQIISGSTGMVECSQCAGGGMSQWEEYGQWAGVEGEDGGDIVLS